MKKYKLYAFDSDALEDIWLWNNNKLVPGSKKRAICADIVYREEDGLYPSLETIADIYERGKGNIEIYTESDDGKKKRVNIDTLGVIYVSAYPYRGEINGDKAVKAIKQLHSQKKHLTLGRDLLKDFNIPLAEGDKSKRCKTLEQLLEELQKQLDVLPRKTLQRMIQKYIKEEL